MPLMEELLVRLEHKIKALIEQQNQFKKSNRCLNQAHVSLASENRRLLLKQEHTASQIEALIAKLKFIESNT